MNKKENMELMKLSVSRYSKDAAQEACNVLDKIYDDFEAKEIVSSMANYLRGKTDEIQKQALKTCNGGTR